MVDEAISFWTDIQRYEDMLVADPRSYCFAPLSELYRKLGLLDDAISVAKKGCDMHPDYPRGFLALGSACHAKGLTAEAKQALERAVELDPDNLDAKKLLGQLCVDTGDVALAAKVLHQVLEQAPEDVESGMLLRSIAPKSAAVQPEEELLEEVEVIEDLTELLDESEAPETAAAEFGISIPRPPSPAEGAPAAPVAPFATQAQTREPAASKPIPLQTGAAMAFEAFDDSEDLWAIEATDEPPEFSPLFEEVGEPALTEPAEFEAFGVAEAAGLPEMAAPSPTSEVSGISESFEEFETSEAFAFKEPAARQQPVRDPLTTATLAELYVTQGFTEKALAIYEELLAAEPSNPPYRLRCAELREQIALQQEADRVLAPAPPATEVPAQAKAPDQPRDAEGELKRWLENIRRRRDGV